MCCQCKTSCEPHLKSIEFLKKINILCFVFVKTVLSTDIYKNRSNAKEKWKKSSTIATVDQILASVMVNREPKIVGLKKTTLPKQMQLEDNARTQPFTATHT